MRIKKKAALIFPTLPNTFFGGGALTAYGIMLSFLNAGFEVSVLSWADLKNSKDAMAKNSLENLGVEVHCLMPPKFNLFNKISSCINNNIKASFPHYNSQAGVKNRLEKIKPDILVVYHWEALASVYGLNSFPKIGLVGDPVHLPYLYRMKFEKDSGSVKYLGGLLSYFIKNKANGKKMLMKELLSDCSVSGAFAAHHAQMFRDWGVSSCQYFRTPLPDPFLNGEKSRNLPSKPKILLLGHLRGVATLSGIEIFSNEILPYLENELGENNFEVHIVGDFHENLPKLLKRKLNKPSILFRGHISPIDQEFLTSHLLLVPTPIELGIRVRILTAFSFATPVVAHIANMKGIPELEHEKNVLFSDSGKGIAAQVIRLIRDNSLQKYLSENSRKAFEDCFSLGSAGRTIVESARNILCH